MLERIRYRLFDCLSGKEAYGKHLLLEEMQWRSHEELQRIQSEKLRKLVVHAYNNTMYYRRLFDAMGLTPNDIHDVRDLEKLPVLTKSIIKQNIDLFKASAYESYGPRLRATSGSTGEAFHFVIDRDAHGWVHGYLLLSWKTAGFAWGDRVMTIGAGNIKHSRLKRFCLEYLRNSIDIPSFDFDEDVMTATLRRINDVRPGIIYGYSSALAFLSKYAMDHSINIASPKAVVTTAENLLPHNRERIEHAFGCQVYDQYGVMECGITAYECNEHAGFHLGMTKGIVETVDDAGRRVYDAPGRILGTDLDNYAFPMIRYDSGDVGSISGRTCACGRGFEMLDSLQGRVREFLTTKSGSKVHGAIFSYLVRNHPWINQYQVVQEVAGSIEVRIVMDSPLSSEQEQAVVRFVNDQCGNDMDINVKRVCDIPMSSNNKRHFIISKISNI
jgi:phenylacetate-CoA ligase